MSVTPEGKIKDLVKEVLNKYNVYYFMPVQSGYGAAGLDFHCVINVRDHVPYAFFIETKAPTKKLTARQKILADKLSPWIIDGKEGVERLDQWLQQLLLCQFTLILPPRT